MKETESDLVSIIH